MTDPSTLGLDTGQIEVGVPSERERWHADVAIKNREQERLEAEFQFRREEALRTRWWSNPLVLAVIAATVAALGNAGVTWLTGRDQMNLAEKQAAATQDIQKENNKDQLKLEGFKAESSRLLEAIKTNNPDTAATNLDFLLKTGLVSNQETAGYLKEYLSTRKIGQGPTLPVSGAGSVSSTSNCCTITSQNGPSRQVAGVTESECKVIAVNTPGAALQWTSGSCFQ